MKKPNFFIVGAPRCGTTAMQSYLGQHPDIFMAERKECHFFGRDLTALFGPVTEEEYLSYFTNVRQEKRVGEASVLYLVSKHAAEEIKAFSPDARIIIMLRNPTDILYSLHTQLMYSGIEDIKDFGVALAAEEERKQGLRIAKSVRTPQTLFYREIAKLAQQTERYLRVFGPENVHVVIFDDFKADTAGAYRRTLQFLGVDADIAPDFAVVNANQTVRSKLLQRLISNRRWGRSYSFKRRIPSIFRKALRRLNTVRVPRPAMPRELRAQLQAEFAPEVQRLGELLGHDLTHWSREV